MGESYHTTALLLFTFSVPEQVLVACVVPFPCHNEYLTYSPSYPLLFGFHSGLTNARFKVLIPASQKGIVGVACLLDSFGAPPSEDSPHLFHEFLSALLVKHSGPSVFCIAKFKA